MNTHRNIAQDTGPKTFLSCSFNQDYGCFAVSHDSGFRVYSSDPLELRVDRRFQDGGIGISQMLYRTNYLALVGGGHNPKYSQNKVIIWDDLKHRPAISLEFLSSILNVLLSRTRIVVVLKNKVHVYAFSSPPSQIAAYETADNPHGIAALAGSHLAFPSRTPGQIQIVNLEDNLVSIVRAHKSAIRCLALNNNGTILASASDTGTIIRLHTTSNTAFLHEFRRGLDRAEVYSMAFSNSSRRLAILSDKNTLHVFDTSSAVANRRHLLSKVPLLPSYFSSEWSFVSARVAGHRGVVGWSAEDSIIVVWTSDKCKWEKYDIVERESSPSGNEEEREAPRWELVREAWRSFEGFD
ncbi:SVP1-like protein 2 [Trichomonascus vanleenenianus]|uniref:phosphatidylinositol-3,5-bisphosphate binding protein HSV2 n=1 Tax=Trichomonascus vanleenenianus TaxID=2268995 RepID=UPI003EC9F0D5